MSGDRTHPEPYYVSALKQPACQPAIISIIPYISDTYDCHVVMILRSRHDQCAHYETIGGSLLAHRHCDARRRPASDGRWPLIMLHADSGTGASTTLTTSPARWCPIRNGKGALQAASAPVERTHDALPVPEHARGHLAADHQVPGMDRPDEQRIGQAARRHARPRSFGHRAQAWHSRARTTVPTAPDARDCPPDNAEAPLVSRFRLTDAGVRSAT